jgi:hypothetical protein
MPERTKPIHKRFLENLTWEAAWAFFPFKTLFATAVSVITALAGFAQTAPLWELIPYTVAAFGFTLWGFHWLDAALARRNLAGKVAFDAPQARPVVPPGSREQTGLQVVAYFTNFTSEALEYEVEIIDTRVGDRFAPDKDFHRSGIIPPYGRKSFSDSVITLPAPTGVESGWFHIKLRYGLLGKKMKYEAEQMYRTVIGPPVVAGHPWRFEAYEDAKSN